MTYQLVYAKQAVKDAKKLKGTPLAKKVKELLKIVSHDPFKNPPTYEKLLGDFAGAYSRRINIQHRLVYEVFQKERVVRILRMWTHYQ